MASSKSYAVEESDEENKKYKEELKRDLQNFLDEKYENSEIESKYKILNDIGEGGFGIVFLIKDQNNGLK